MGRKLKHDHKMSNLELQHEFQDRASAIDIELDEAFKHVDWKRRVKASRSLIDFIKTYFVGLMVDTPPSAKFVEALREMEFALS